MNPTKTLYFFLVVSTTLCLVPATQAIAANESGNSTAANESGNLVEQVCEGTRDKQQCIASLQSNKDSQKANLPELVIIALRLASANATETSVFIKNSLTNQTLDPSVEQGLEDCSDYYKDAIEQLDDSINSLLEKDTEDIQTWVDTAITDLDECEAAFKGLTPLLEKRNAYFRQLCDDVLAINKQYAAKKQ